MNQKSKTSEKECLDIVRKIKRIPELQGNIQESERPDFIINDIGIEHFFIDIIINKKDSLNKIQLNNINKKINYYKNNQNILEQDIENRNAVNFIQDIINQQIEGVYNFKYNEYIDNFKRIYNKHYKSIPYYRTKCRQVGFLIEMTYIENIIYSIKNNKNIYEQRIKTLPITRNMIECFKYINNVDFIILFIKPFNFDGNHRKCTVVKIDMKDIENSIRNQGLVVCDAFDYPIRYKNKNHIQLSVTK